MTEQNLTLLIINGKHADHPGLREAIYRLRTEGNNIAVRVTWEQGDAARYVIEALRLEAETLVAGGGDGTINEIVTAMIQRKNRALPSLGILPLGTANDFAASAGIPETAEQALRLAMFAKAVSIDLACVNQQYYFINMATGGFGTRITRQTPERLKTALGGLSYFIHGMMRMDQLKADSCQISGPDFSWQGDALVIGIGNGRQAGGGQRLCPQALINDGLLNLSVIRSQELLPAILHSLTISEANPSIMTAALPWLKIRSPHEMTFNLDGEPLSGREFYIEVVPEKLQCRLPDGCLLLS